MAKNKTKVKAQENESISPLIGSWAFMFGMLLAILAGLGFAEKGWAYLTLGILGLIVGYLNINEHESVPFLVAAIALVTAGTGLGSILTVIPGGVGEQFLAILHYIVSFVAPAAGIVALKTLYEIGRSPSV